MRTVTIVGVIRSMGIPPMKDLTWRVGGIVSDIYWRRHGVLPPTALLPKTNGGGSHHFAVYPAEPWEKIIQEVVRRFRPDTSEKKKGK